MDLKFPFLVKSGPACFNVLKLGLATNGIKKSATVAAWLRMEDFKHVVFGHN